MTELQQHRIQISTVIPTCNRKPALLTLLKSLDRSLFPLSEVIIVDSGEDRLVPAEYNIFKNLNIRYLGAEKSVCIQRNLGIREARSPWIFLCDDDVEMPPDYLQHLVSHVARHEEAGAVSGLFMQKDDGGWSAKYPERSARSLFLKFIFQLGLWGGIDCPDKNILIKKIKKHYLRKGNHLSKAGWPVIVDITGDHFTTPTYTLGASLVKRDWLIASPYDEVLDRHGIGDNYGVILGFPTPSVRVLNNAYVYHHQEPANRLQRPYQYFRRVLAIDYFIRAKPKPLHRKKGWILWSLAGNMLAFIRARDWRMVRSSFKAIWLIALDRNPYALAAKAKKKVTEPLP